MSNNLFDYATKELSQDAIILWLLNEEDIAVVFLNDILRYDINGKELQSSTVIENNACITKNPDDHRNTRKQYNDIDVLVLAKTKSDSDKNKVAVIIEDKTDTSLHDNQVEKYTRTIREDAELDYKDAVIHFVLFKTGYYTFWERDDFAQELQQLNISKVEGHFYSKDNLLQFLKSCKSFNPTWKDDYLNYLESLNSEKDSALNTPEFRKWATDLNNSLDSLSKELLKVQDDRLCIHIDKAQAKGKRPWGLSVFGICGKEKDKYNRNEGNFSIEKQYYLYPYVKFDIDKKTASIYIQYNVRFAESKRPEGYLPRDKQEKRIQEAWKAKTCDVKKVIGSRTERLDKKSYLQVYKHTIENVEFSMMHENEEFKKALNEAVDIALEIEKSIFSNNVD